MPVVAGQDKDSSSEKGPSTCLLQCLCKVSTIYTGWKFPGDSNTHSGPETTLELRVWYNELCLSGTIPATKYSARIFDSELVT